MANQDIITTSSDLTNLPDTTESVESPSVDANPKSNAEVKVNSDSKNDTDAKINSDSTSNAETKSDSDSTNDAEAKDNADSKESKKAASLEELKAKMSPEELARFEAIKEKLRQRKLAELRLQKYYELKDRVAYQKKLELEKIKKAKIRKFVYLGTFVLLVAICVILYLTTRYSSDEINNQAGMLFKNYQSESYYKYDNSMLNKIEKPSNFRSYVSAEHTEEMSFVKQHAGDVGNLTQAVFSPDKQSILFSTVVYNYDGSDPENDEFCFYYVMDINTQKPSLLFKGFRQWYEIDWR